MNDSLTVVSLYHCKSVSLFVAYFLDNVAEPRSRNFARDVDRVFVDCHCDIIIRHTNMSSIMVTVIII